MPPPPRHGIGVTLDKSNNTYKARLTVGDKQFQIGRFSTSHEACLAYDLALDIAAPVLWPGEARPRNFAPGTAPPYCNADVEARTRAALAALAAATAGAEAAAAAAGLAAPAAGAEPLAAEQLGETGGGGLLQLQLLEPVPDGFMQLLQGLPDADDEQQAGAVDTQLAGSGADGGVDSGSAERSVLIGVASAGPASASQQQQQQQAAGQAWVQPGHDSTSSSADHGSGALLVPLGPSPPCSVQALKLSSSSDVALFAQGAVLAMLNLDVFMQLDPAAQPRGAMLPASALEAWASGLQVPAEVAASPAAANLLQLLPHGLVASLLPTAVPAPDGSAMLERALVLAVCTRLRAALQTLHRLASMPLEHAVTAQQVLQQWLLVLQRMHAAAQADAIVGQLMGALLG